MLSPSRPYMGSQAKIDEKRRGQGVKEEANYAVQIPSSFTKMER